MTHLTPAEQRDKQYRELAATIAGQAQALADGTTAGPRYAMARLILSNAEQLVAETPDDRSGMPAAGTDEPGLHEHVRQFHLKVTGHGVPEAELARRHGGDHFQYGSATHHHGPDAGPHARPEGWRTGGGVVLIDRQAAMRRRPAGLRMHQQVSVTDEGLGEIIGMLSGEPRKYRVKILGTRPARVVTVTRDKIRD